MRTTADRIRHTISFELSGMLCVISMGAWLFNLAPQEFGIVTVIGSIVATSWNYLYNLGFDHALKFLRGTVKKTLALRAAHAVFFEVGLLSILIPFMAWFLGIALWQALVINVTFGMFYLGYAFVFNWVYDLAFPVDEGAMGPVPVAEQAA